jgi:hypothetical protein
VIISFQDVKCANNEWYKHLTNVNIGIFLKIEDCEGVVLYLSKHGNLLKEYKIVWNEVIFCIVLYDEITLFLSLVAACL